MTVELVYDPECPNTEQARVTLRRALGDVGTDPQWIEWNASSPETPARVKGFGSPAILVDGRDVAGALPSEAACCRFYEFARSTSGAPPAELVLRGLLAAKRQRAGVRPPALAAIVLAIAVLLATGGSVAAEPSAVSSSASAVAIPVEGMTCAVCAAHVKKALRAMDGVADVEISLEHRTARVRYQADRVKPEDLVGAVNRLGYEAGAPTVHDGSP